MSHPLWIRRLRLIAATLVIPGALGAQAAPSGGSGFFFGMPRASIGIRGGFSLARANAGPDGFFAFATRELTLGKSDFNAMSLRADLDAVVAGPIDVVFGVGYTVAGAPSEFRDWVDQNDRPIAQRTRLSTKTYTVAARWNITSRGRRIGQFIWIPARVLPYVGVGAGALRYSLWQDGYFVDAQDLSIFRDHLASHGWTVLALVMAGADYSLGKRLFASAEARYQWANAELRQDFVGFDDGIDLSGLQLSLGLHVRI
jgi:hypothetical protein